MSHVASFNHDLNRLRLLRNNALDLNRSGTRLFLNLDYSLLHRKGAIGLDESFVGPAVLVEGVVFIAGDVGILLLLTVVEGLVEHSTIRILYSKLSVPLPALVLGVVPSVVAIDEYTDAFPDVVDESTCVLLFESLTSRGSKAIGETFFVHFAHVQPDGVVILVFLTVDRLSPLL